jgi:phosphotriesterase-related protein
MNRRKFLHTAATGLAGLALRRPARAKEETMIQTVRGPIAPDQLGVTLIHEHVLVDFIGADKVSPDRYDPDEVFRVALPHLRRLRELGGQSLAECTPMYLGRDPALLARLSEASGVHLLTNTGQYKEPFLPPATFTLSAEEIAAQWIAEAREGIAGTGLRPAFLKIAVNDGDHLSPIQEKVVRAAAKTSRATGLPIAAHTGGGPVEHSLDVLAEEGVAADAFLWVHAQAEPNRDRHIAIARRGAWVEFDGIAPNSIDVHVQYTCHLLEQGYGHRVLLSHDAGWYHVGEAGGGDYRGYDTLFTTFLPALRAAGVDEATERQLLVDNPRAALTPRAHGPEPGTKGM